MRDRRLRHGGEEVLHSRPFHTRDCGNSCLERRASGAHHSPLCCSRCGDEGGDPAVERNEERKVMNPIAALSFLLGITLHVSGARQSEPTPEMQQEIRARCALYADRMNMRASSDPRNAAVRERFMEGCQRIEEEKVQQRSSQSGEQK